MTRQQPGEDALDRLVLSGGRRVGLARFGRTGGWPLVYCHGGLSSRLEGKLLDEAGKRHGADIIAIDRPGIGCSDAWAMPSIGDFGHLVEQLADRLHLEQFAVAGWSAGGAYALACAAAMPERVRAVATLAGMKPLENFREIWELGLPADLLLIPAARWSPHAAAALLWLGKWPLRWLPDRSVRWEMRRTAGIRDRAALNQTTGLHLITALRDSMLCGVRGTAADFRRFSKPSWGFDLRQVQQPVTIWHAEHDTLLPISHAHHLADVLPNSTLKVVSDAGHYLPVVIADEAVEGLVPTTR
jgi:pimeloyl-ACP methyl ester carboxylesterase